MNFFYKYIYFWLVCIKLCMAKPTPYDGKLLLDSEYNLPNEVILFVLPTNLIVFVVAIIVAVISQSSLSDSDFKDVAAEEQIIHNADNERSSRVSLSWKISPGERCELYRGRSDRYCTRPHCLQ